MQHSGSVPLLQLGITDHLTTKGGQFNSTRSSAHLHNFQKQLNESALKSSRDALATDLEKSKYQIKEFEGKVSNVLLVNELYVWSGEPIGLAAEGEIIHDGGLCDQTLTTKK